MTGVQTCALPIYFTTLAGADFSVPFVVHASVDTSQYVGTNAAFAMQFNKPMDPGSVNPGGVNSDVFVYDYNLGTYATVTISFSADLTTVMLKPTANLTASHQFQLCSYYMTDLSGNPQQNFCVNFYTGAGTDTTGPVVQQVSPPSGFTGVGINAPVQILFNTQISGASIGGVSLTQGTSTIPTTATLFDGDMGIQLTPLTPLSPGTVYTINVTGVTDITGNVQSAFSSTSFTTGTGTDLVQPSWLTTTPANGATGVAASTTVKVVFSKAMDPASFDPNNYSFTLTDASGNFVPATITFSTDYKTVTLHPKASLNSGGATYYMYIGYYGTVRDVTGNGLSNGTYISFQTL